LGHETEENELKGTKLFKLEARKKLMDKEQISCALLFPVHYPESPLLSS
jgi:hypothetical protein